MKIGWIGVGVMGRQMVMHLKDAGHDVKVYNRTFSKIVDLESYGIIPCKSIKELVNDVELIITMVGYPKDVKEVYLGDKGIFNTITNNNCICIDMTTSSPLVAQEIAKEFFLKKGIHILDAPVSGGDIGAKNKTLSIMVGGDKQTFESIKHIFETLGKNIVYHGPSGFGHHAKMANQIAIAGTIASVCESLYYCYVNKLSVNNVLKSIESGAAGSWQLSNNGKNIINNYYKPGFYIHHFIKDMEIVKSVIGKNKLPVLETVLKMYKKLSEKNMQHYGTQALIYYYVKS